MDVIRLQSDLKFIAVLPGVRTQSVLYELNNSTSTNLLSVKIRYDTYRNLTNLYFKICIIFELIKYFIFIF